MEMKWLSRGNVLTQPFLNLVQKLKCTLKFTDTKPNLKNLFVDELRLCQLAYLSYIFYLVNEINKNFQEFYMPFSVYNKTKALRKKKKAAHRHE